LQITVVTSQNRFRSASLSCS